MDDAVVPLVAHDLQNPLTSIRGYIQMTVMLGEQTLPPDLKRSLSMALISCDQLSRMVVSLSLLSQLEEGTYKLCLEETRPADVARGAVQASQAFADAQGKGIVERFEPVAEAVRVDVLLLDQALRNVIANGLARIRSKEKITVGVRTMEGMVEIGVEDGGPAIPEDLGLKMLATESQTEVKEAGFKTDRALGLVLFARSVAAMDGQVGVDSHGGRTSFWMRFPVVAGRAEAA